ncbi:MAG TPA: helix-hairpin-helix domain-containing protein, partial [Thermoplasmata archaeon]|nr:helix-hairpin-helix domain-containing protein [Thermoplasmata archaeon]
RSLTAVEYPLDANRASLHALTAVPGVGEKRAARIVRGRPFQSAADLAKAFDEPAAAARATEFLTVGG